MEKVFIFLALTLSFLDHYQVKYKENTQQYIQFSNKSNKQLPPYWFCGNNSIQQMNTFRPEDDQLN